MSFYESVFIARQEISAQQADALAETFSNVIAENGGTVSKRENWGLKSLDKPERKPKPAPTADELKAHYAKFGLAFQPKPESPASCDPASAPPAKLTASLREERN